MGCHPLFKGITWRFKWESIIHAPLVVRRNGADGSILPPFVTGKPSLWFIPIGLIFYIYKNGIVCDREAFCGYILFSEITFLIVVSQIKIFERLF